MNPIRGEIPRWITLGKGYTDGDSFDFLYGEDDGHGKGNGTGDPFNSIGTDETGYGDLWYGYGDGYGDGESGHVENDAREIDPLVVLAWGVFE